MTSYEIINGDCLIEMPKLIERGVTVDAVITDPPYNASNSSVTFTEKGFAAVNEAWDKDFDPLLFVDLAFKLLKPNGCMVVCCSYHLLGSYLGWHRPQQIIHWRKTNPFPAIGKVYTPTIEYALWFVKGSPYTFNRPYAGQNIIDLPACNGDERCGHPTQKPIDLMRRFVAVHSNPGDTILDPFSGSFTTGVACAIKGRNFIGIEQSEEYCRIGEARMKRASGIPCDIPKLNRRQIETPLFTER